jgi:HEXXH motif-containing protein
VRTRGGQIGVVRGGRGHDRASVEAAVGKVYLLRAAAGYDISHSEPQWKSWIFVSLPDRADSVGALRLAEGVVHEAMHLQLTVFEDRNAIVADESGRMSSPWRRQARPFRGIAHGLFVFSCILAYFEALIDVVQGPAASHVLARIEDIRAEIATIDLEELSRGLTPIGAALARRWSDVALANT